MIHIKSLNCRGGSMRWQLKCTTIISFRRDKYEQKRNKQTKYCYTKDFMATSGAGQAMEGARRAVWS